MSNDDRFQNRIKDVTEILNKTVAYHDYLEKELQKVEVEISTLKAEGMPVERAEVLISDAKEIFQRSKGLDDYKEANSILQSAQRESKDMENRVQRFLTMVSETLANVNKYSDMGLDMGNALKLLSQARTKMNNREHQAAILFASRAWNLTEQIYQKYEQLNGYREHIQQRFDECSHFGIVTPDIPILIKELDEHIKRNELKLAYDKIEALSAILDNREGDYVNEMIQEVYYEINRHSGVPLNATLEVLSQAEYSMSQGDFGTAIEMARKARPLLEEEMERYHRLRKKVESISGRLFHAKNLGVQVFQAESALNEADAALQVSEYQMAEGYLQQADNELKSLEYEVQMRERQGIEHLKRAVDNGLRILKDEIETEKARGVDTDDPESILSKILEMLSDASNIDEFRKIQEYLGPAHSALSRARSRFNKKESEEQHGRQDIDDMAEKIKQMESVINIPNSILAHLQKAEECYSNKEYVEVTRNLGQMEQFFSMINDEDVDLEIDMEVIQKEIVEGDWAKTKMNIVNLSHLHLNHLRFEIGGVDEVKGMRNIRDFHGNDKTAMNFFVKFKELGQNNVKVRVKGRKTIDRSIFRMVVKTDVFVGKGDKWFEDELGEDGSIEWS